MNYKFEGRVGEYESSAQRKIVWKDYEPKICGRDGHGYQISHCGACGSDIYVLKFSWVSVIYLRIQHRV